MEVNRGVDYYWLIARSQVERKISGRFWWLKNNNTTMMQNWRQSCWSMRKYKIQIWAIHLYWLHSTFVEPRFSVPSLQIFWAFWFQKYRRWGRGSWNAIHLLVVLNVLALRHTIKFNYIVENTGLVSHYLRYENAFSHAKWERNMVGPHVLETFLNHFDWWRVLQHLDSCHYYCSSSNSATALFICVFSPVADWVFFSNLGVSW